MLIYIVEDDIWYAKVLNHYLSLNPNYNVKIFETGKKILNELKNKPDVICMDYTLTDIQGDKLLIEIKKRCPETTVIVISGQEEISIAVNLLKLGAHDYLVKNEYTKEILWKSINNINQTKKLKEEIIDLKGKIVQNYNFEKIVGKSDAIKKTFPLLEKAIKTNINVSLQGATGTGKEVYAQTIHYNSARKNGPFVAINMAAIPDELIESELFGHEKGSFTGAILHKKGKFLEASGGTLFLDEISELNEGVQAKLLRALQEREITPVGGNKPIGIDIRLISASSEKLIDLVNKGKFREDLFYRIVGLPIELPKLIERDNDVIILSNYFIEKYCQENNIELKKLDFEAITKLKSHNFPGNVRELKSTIELACVLSNNSLITKDDIQYYQPTKNKINLDENKSLDEVTAEIIQSSILKNKNNVSLAAKKLQISRTKIYAYIKKYNISIN
jgi:DNA-binding NtrC family response regulator